MARTSPPARFRDLYRDNYGFVWYAARRFGVAEGQLDDVVQDTFLTAYRRMNAWHGDGARPWLYGIARRVASNYRRADHRRTRRHEALADARPPGDLDAPRLEALHALDSFMQSLELDMREVFVLSELEGMSGSEVATALAMPVSTAYDRIRAARTRFSAHLQDRGALVVARARAERPVATERAWNRLVACLPIGKGVPWLAAGWAATAKLAAATAGGVVAILWAQHSVVRQAPHDVLPSPTDTNVVIANAAAPRVVAELPVAELSAVVGVAPPIAHEPARAPSPRPSDGPAFDEPTPANETAWLSEAARRLAAGDATAALALTDRHARAFERSALADVRAALRIESLCHLGKHAQGRAEAHVLLAARPNSPVAARVQSACEAERAGPTGPAERANPANP